METRPWRIAAVIVAGLIVVGGLAAVTVRTDDSTTDAGGNLPDRLPDPTDDIGDPPGDSADDIDTDDTGADDTGASDLPDSDLDAFVDEAIAFIEPTRGLSFLERPVVVVLSDPDFVARVDDDLEELFAEDPDLVEEFTVLYRALRLIDPDEMIDEEYRAFGSAGILGFYDAETDELYVREGDGLSLLTRGTIVHELVHALDDQHFDLDRPEYEDRTDEIPWTFSAVVEGSASYVEGRWVGSLSPSEQRDLQAEELGFADPSVFDEFTFAFLTSELSVYWEGEPFVARLVDEGGTAALDQVIGEPPPSSEQVMEPAAWESGDAPIEVPLPPADGEVVSSGIAGQVLIESLLSEVMFGPDIETAAQGWGGDGFVAWRQGSVSCIRWDLVADTQDDLEELRAGLSAWAEAAGSAAVSTPEPGVLRLDSCA